MNEAEPNQDTADDLQDITHVLKSLSSDVIRLVVVEARLFGHTVLAMVRLCLVIMLLMVGGWVLAGAAAVMALATLETFSLTGALVTVAMANFALAALACWRLRHITRDLMFHESWTSVNTLIAHARSLTDPETGEHRHQ